MKKQRKNKDLTMAELTLVTLYFNMPHLTSRKLAKHLGKKSCTVRVQLPSAARKLGKSTRYELLTEVANVLWMCSRCGSFNNPGSDRCVFCVRDVYKKDLVTIREMSKILGVSYSRIYWTIISGKFPAHSKFGGILISRKYIKSMGKYFNGRHL